MRSPVAKPASFSRPNNRVCAKTQCWRQVQRRGCVAFAERMARSQREAKVLASLSHPDIATIYGLEDSGTTRALVMELVEGPTLAGRIKSGRFLSMRPSYRQADRRRPGVRA
jgi:serine/threonine protein kinase